METGLVHLHNFLRWVILILLLVSIYKSYTGWRIGRALTAGDKKVWLFTMISGHITLVLGLIQVFFGRMGVFTVSLPEGTSVMSDPSYRFFWVEHPIAMIAAIALITVGRGMAKKSVADEVKFRKAFVFFLLALIVILAAIPWDRPIFPGMSA